jgi:hypothetical protein
VSRVAALAIAMGAALAALAAALALCGCQSASSSRSAPPRDSVVALKHPAVPPPSVQMAQVESTLVRFNLALASGDRDSLEALTGDGFTLIEGGREYNRDQMIESVERTLESGSMIRTPVDFDVELEGRVAWTRYHVVGEFRTPEKRTLISLLETAVVLRREGEWRVMQMSSLPELVK